MKLSHTVISGVIALCCVLPAQAALHTFGADLTGAAESPPNASPATGTTVVVYDDVLHMLAIAINFSGLMAPTTVAHIHAGVLSDALTVGVAVTPGTLPGFPAGVTSADYDVVVNLSLAGSYTATFVTNYGGGTVAGAEAALFSFMQAGTAYVNVHTTSFPAGEIRGFLLPITESPTVPDATATVCLFSFALGVMGLIARRSRIAA